MFSRVLSYFLPIKYLYFEKLCFPEFFSTFLTINLFLIINHTFIKIKILFIIINRIIYYILKKNPLFHLQ